MQGYFCAAFGANLVQMVFAALGLNPVMNIMCLPFALVVSVIASTTVFRNVFITYDSFSSEGNGPSSSNSTPLNYSGRLAMSGSRMNSSRRVTTEIPLNDYKSTGAAGTISVHRVIELAHDEYAPHTRSEYGSETSPKSGPSSAEGTPNPESRRARRRRQRRESEPATPAPQLEASGSGSKLKFDETPRLVEAREQPKSQRSGGFEDGADYISFGFKDDEDTKSVAVSGRDKGKGVKRKKDSFDLDDGYESKKQRLDAASRKSPWVADLDWTRCRHVAELLHREVEAFMNYISPTAVEDEVRGLVVALITRAVTKKFPDASVHAFGSYATKLYLPLGDIDLVILSQSMAYSDKVTVLHALANTLRRAGITERVTIIAKAKVPIVKFVTTHGRFNVDISLNQDNGIISGNIINGFLKDLNGSGGVDGKGSLALRSLVMITKAFLSQRSMNEVFSGGLGSYSIVCLAVSFLQMHPKIRRGEIDANSNLGVLVMEFFELYGCYFNYNEVGISLREGGMYFSKRSRGWLDHYKQGLLSIEDPADPSNDISRGSFAFQKVRQTFAGAHSILTSSAYLTAGILSSRRQGTAVSFGDEPEELSVLSRIMGVTQETINHRKLVQEVYDKRVLHNLLNVQAQPVVVNGSTPKGNGTAKPSSTSTGEAANSVKSAWAEADNEDVNSHKRQHNATDEEEEEGRYRIGRQQPPTKRRRTGSRKDAHITFTTDEETLSEDEKEDLHYESDIEIIEGKATRPPSSRDSEKADKRRSYWLSKAIGIGSSVDCPFLNLSLDLWVSTVAGRLVARTHSSKLQMNSKGQPQPGNLKERIAALEQRNVLPSSDRPLSPSIPLTPGAVPNSAGLRDRIAKFERKGGVPVPRGSFGLGAPPIAENAPLKRRGELWGNRIPGMRAVSGITSGPAGPPFNAGRVVSMPNLDGDCNAEADGENLPSSPSSTSSPSPQFMGLTPQHTGTMGTITPQTTGSAVTPQSTGSREPALVTSFATALELARKVETESQTEAPIHPAAVVRAASPTSTTSDTEGKSVDTASAPMPTSIIPENQEDVDTAPAQSQVSSPPDTSDEPVTAAEPATPPQPSTPSIVLSPSAEQANPLDLFVPEESTKMDVAEEMDEITEPTASALPTVIPLVVPPAPDATQIELKPHVEPASDKIPSVSLSPAESTLSQSTTNTDQSPPSPLGPFSLANAVHDLGKVVPNIQDVFPGQISPLAAPPSCRTLIIDIPSMSKEPNTPTDTKNSIPDLESKLESPSKITPSESRPTRVPATSSVTKSTELLTSPRSGNARPVSMFATSSKHVAYHMTPTASRDALLPGSQKSDASTNKDEHFPPTPEPKVSEFGATKGHKSSQSLSQTTSSTEQSKNAGSFTAVVHKKVTEIPSTVTASSSSYLSIYTKVSETPKKSSESEPLVSPGYGELAALLHEAALLEFSLEHGELPSDGSKNAGLEPNEETQTEKEGEEEEERGKQAVVKARTEEGKRKHENAAKARGKQEALESKSKSTFLDPLLRSNSAQKREESTDSKRCKEPIRSQSVVLPFRPLPEPPSLRIAPLTITPIPEKEATCPVDVVPEAETKSPTQTSPRSLRYFTSLKRFASASKTSLTSNSQPRDSVSASSEVSSEDWSVIPTPAGNGAETESSKGGLFNGPGIGWQVLSPKKSPGVGRSASFTDKIFNRRKTSKTSEISSVGDTNSAYEAIGK
ncbi:hypothetical protein C0992_008669 [Termitomyces sp. T32_za158]|nr:hypothetical protein C0992_008669 [Termitomyces sp. T32_za158]